MSRFNEIYSTMQSPYYGGVANCWTQFRHLNKGRSMKDLKSMYYNKNYPNSKPNCDYIDERKSFYHKPLSKGRKGRKTGEIHPNARAGLNKFWGEIAKIRARLLKENPNKKPRPLKKYHELKRTGQLKAYLGMKDEHPKPKPIIKPVIIEEDDNEPYLDVPLVELTKNDKAEILKEAKKQITPAVLKKRINDLESRHGSVDEEKVKKSMIKDVQSMLEDQYKFELYINKAKNSKLYKDYAKYQKEKGENLDEINQRFYNAKLIYSYSPNSFVKEILRRIGKKYK